MPRLFQDSGSTGTARRAEAEKLIQIIGDDRERVLEKDSRFLDDLKRQLQHIKFEPTAHQIFWLRDIKDKTL